VGTGFIYPQPNLTSGLCQDMMTAFSFSRATGFLAEFKSLTSFSNPFAVGTRQYPYDGLHDALPGLSNDDGDGAEHPH